MPDFFSDKVIAFNKALKLDIALPQGFSTLNPYLENPETLVVMVAFYKKYYQDKQKRKFIIGINPSRKGAGVTGVPFTDTKRLSSECGIQMHTAHTHEISSVFMYEMIRQYGGAAAFYKDYYINSPMPLAIIKQGNHNTIVNANYYDTNPLFLALKSSIVHYMQWHFALGLERENVIVLGKKNAKFITQLNQEYRFFNKMEVLDHPRFIEQYQSKNRQKYIDHYLEILSQ